jgi:hypothetical protein
VEVGLRRSSELYVHDYPFRCLAMIRLAAGNLDAARKIYNELSSQHPGTTSIGWTWAIVRIGSIAPGIADEPAALVTLAESLRGEVSKHRRGAIPLAYARTGRWQDVIDFVARDDEVASLQMEIAPLLAMAHQQLGNTREAQAHLGRRSRTRT